jgi:hypothetical protein
MKCPHLLFLTLVMLLGAVSGCHVATQPAEFSDVPDYMVGKTRPRATVVDIEIMGARPGMERTALVNGIRKAMGPASTVYPEREKMSDAQKLADSALAGSKVTLHLPPDMAKTMAHNLEEAGLVVRLSE